MSFLKAAEKTNENEFALKPKKPQKTMQLKTAKKLQIAENKNRQKLKIEKYSTAETG
jgi:hypothetical protein